MPIMHKPQKPLPEHYVPRGGRRYTAKTDESLASIARDNGIAEAELLMFNFGTTDPKEVNWYLKRLGCTKATPDDNNWMFTSSWQHPQVIYLPPIVQAKNPLTPPQTKIERYMSSAKKSRRLVHWAARGGGVAWPGSGHYPSFELDGPDHPGDSSIRLPSPDSTTVEERGERNTSGARVRDQIAEHGCMDKR
jgi:hypothetical protein